MTLPAVTAMTGLVPLIATTGIVLTVSERMLQQKAAKGQTVRKVSKRRAGYVERSRKRQKCSTCEFYSDGQCELVRGTVNSGGWCKLWARGT